MRQTKSYMLPKLICLNVLALMMFTFQHNTTADDQLLQTAEVTEPTVSDPGALMQVAVAQPVVDSQKAAVLIKPMAVKREAVYKKRAPHMASIHTQPRLIHTGYQSNSAVDCCFRGNRT